MNTSVFTLTIQSHTYTRLLLGLFLNRLAWPIKGVEYMLQSRETSWRFPSTLQTIMNLLSRHSHMWFCRDHKLQACKDVSCQFGASSLSSKQAPKLRIRSRTFLEARFESNPTQLKPFFCSVSTSEAGKP